MVENEDVDDDVGDDETFFEAETKSVREMIGDGVATVAIAIAVVFVVDAVVPASFQEDILRD